MAEECADLFDNIPLIEPIRMPRASVARVGNDNGVGFLSFPDSPSAIRKHIKRVYGVVGGVVSMFAVLNGGMTNAVNRFLAYEQGKKEGNLNLIFCNCVNIVVLLSIITAIILECVGLWFLQNKLQIPATKMDAAFWVFQFSTIVCIVNILSIPYNAMIIAKEKMGAFAYISVILVWTLSI